MDTGTKSANLNPVVDIEWSFFSSIIKVHIEGDSLVYEIPDFKRKSIRLRDIVNIDYEVSEEGGPADHVLIETNNGVLKLPVDPEENNYAHEFIELLEKIIRLSGFSET